MDFRTNKKTGKKYPINAREMTDDEWLEKMKALNIQKHTYAEMTDDERMLTAKRGRKTKTVLTSITGDNTKATLSKKALLG